MLYIIDSSVFNKLFLDEPGREQAQHLFVRASHGEITLLAPDLLCLEVLSTAQRNQIPVPKIAELIEKQRPLITIRPVTSKEYQTAIQIMQHGHEKSGYPSIYDSLFHAMAICNEGVLVTADKRHAIKTEQLGQVMQLKDVTS